MSKPFKAKIEIIGINPFVFIPDKILKDIFLAAGKDKGPIPVEATLNGESFRQNLVKYAGHWRLYLNTPVRKKTGLDVEDTGTFTIKFDPTPRTEKMPPSLAQALKNSKLARTTFKSLAPSRQKELKRYLNGLKGQAAIERNTTYIMQFLMGEKPQGLHALLRVKKVN